jgi:hypothetical protein
MSAQTIQDIIVIGGMFFLRVGLPLLVVMGIGYLIQRWLEPKAVQEQFEGMVQTAQENAAVGAASQPCWEVKNCSPELRAECPAFEQADVPCWLARQIAGQPLPKGCTTCAVRAEILTTRQSA